MFGHSFATVEPAEQLLGVAVVEQVEASVGDVAGLVEASDVEVSTAVEESVVDVGDDVVLELKVELGTTVEIVADKLAHVARQTTATVGLVVHELGFAIIVHKKKLFICFSLIPVDSWHNKRVVRRMVIVFIFALVFNLFMISFRFVFK